MDIGLFKCPECKKGLSCIKEQQKLWCEKHGDFPIVKGIPSFVKRHRFDIHWENNLCEVIPSQKKVAAQRFLEPFFEYKNHIQRFPYLMPIAETVS